MFDRVLPLAMAAAVLLVACDAPDPQRCSVDEECGTELCLDGVCNPGRGQGQSCVPDEGPVIVSSRGICAEGLLCHAGYDVPVCRPPSPMGGPCTYDGDCGARPGFRDDPVCDLATGAGRCSPPGIVRAGQPCGSDRACEGDLRCARASGAWTCRAPGAEGEACLAVWESNPAPACAKGLYCDDGGACRGRAARGEACADDVRCLEGLVCRLGLCRLPAVAGEPCAMEPDCEDELFCIVGTCRRTSPTGGICGSSLHCDSTERCLLGRCAPPSADGGPCGQGDDCAKGLRCEVGVCSPEGARPIGAPCRTDFVCGDGGVCIDDACRPPSVAEGPCRGSRHCVGGTFCQSGTCVPARPVGTRCISPEQCLSLACDWRQSVCVPEP